MELWQLQQMRALPLEAKIVKTQLRIREWYEHWDGNVYVSFSGGKDSTVLLHIARGLYPEIPAVFSDTGLEFPEIREFVRAMPNVTWVRPDMSFRKVIEKHGYPVISKEQAQWIERARKGDPQVMCEKLYGIRSDGTTQFYTAAAWRHLINAPFKISAECCNEMKKKPLKRYAKESGRVPIVGTMAAESKLREKNWLKAMATPTTPGVRFPCQYPSGRRPMCGVISACTAFPIVRFTTWVMSARAVSFACSARILTQSRRAFSACKRRIPSCGATVCATGTRVVWGCGRCWKPLACLMKIPEQERLWTFRKYPPRG